jgi:hypothetical protein
VRELRWVTCHNRTLVYAIEVAQGTVTVVHLVISFLQSQPMHSVEQILCSNL